MDMAHSNSLQRLYLSDDPDDWVWVRFYFAQETAKSYPGWTAYGHPLFEDRRTGENMLPAIRLEPYKYFPSKVSPFPGQDFRGKPEWFESGLPPEHRVGGEEGTHCGVMRWDGGVEMTLDAQFSSWQVPNPLVAAGGDVDGGASAFGPQSPVVVGRGVAFWNLPLFSQFVSYPAGEPGDLLVMLVRSGTVEGQPLVPPSWTVVERSAEIDGGFRLTVAFKFDPTGAQGNEIYPTEDGLHLGFVARVRDAGRPFGAESGTSIGETATYPALAVAAGYASTILRHMWRWDAPVGPVSTPTGSVPWPGVVQSTFEPNTFLQYDALADQPERASTWSGIRAWGAMTTAIPPVSVLTAYGGDLDLGVAAIAEGYQWTAAGGDVDGGVAGTGSGYHFLPEYGDKDGGTVTEWDTMYPGEIRAFASLIPSSGWIECDGSAVSRTTFAALFSAISTTWGSGDGSTTFNVPDLRGRACIGVGTGSGLTARAAGDTGGEETHQLTSGEMPSHSHNINQPFKLDGAAAGATSVRDATALGVVNITVPYPTLQNTGGDGGHENMQPWAAVSFAIKT